MTSETRRMTSAIAIPPITGRSMLRGSTSRPPGVPALKAMTRRWRLNRCALRMSLLEAITALR